jgi:putative ABC transport system permease protein
VDAVTPILYLTTYIVMGQERSLAYVIGLPENARLGIPWKTSSGSALPTKGGAIIDRNIAEKSNIRLGDEVEILGKEFQVVGFSEETGSLINSIAFISMADFRDLRGIYDSFSFLLVKVDPDVSPSAVAARIESNVRDVTVQSRSDFATQERLVIKDMSTDVITMMNLIGFLIGLAVMALTVYTTVLARRAEFGMLKAIGAKNAHLYLAVLAQAFISVALGFAIGLAVTLALSLVVPRLGLGLVITVSPASLLKVGGLSLLIAGIAAILPIRQIAGLDPATVFRGR